MVKNLLSIRFAFIAVTAMSIGFIVGTGCTTQTTQVPTTSLEPTIGIPILFQDVSKNYTLGGALKGPILLMASDETSLNELTALISKKDQELLKNTNFKQEVVVAVFLGVQPFGGHSITIRNLSINNGQLTVEIQIQERDPNFSQIDAATLPYHLIKIDRDALPNHTHHLKYCLLSENEVIATGELP